MFEFQRREACICGAILHAGAEAITKRFSGGSITFRRCISCGSWCQSPVVTQTALARWLDSAEYRGSDTKRGVAYANYALDEQHRLVEAHGRYARDISPLLGPHSRVLEIGPATGSLLAVIRDHGHAVTGVDLSRTFVEAARTMHGLEIVLGDILDVDLPYGAFDMVLALGTVSNFRSFEASLVRIRKLLAPNGFLMFNFPDADSLWVRSIYRSHFWMYTPSVVTFMTRRGCLVALERAGCDIVSVASDHQRPSLRKILQHARFGFMLRTMEALGLGHAGLPFDMSIPAVRLVVIQSGSTREHS